MPDADGGCLHIGSPCKLSSMSIPSDGVVAGRIVDVAIISVSICKQRARLDSERAVHISLKYAPLSLLALSRIMLQTGDGRCRRWGTNRDTLWWL